MSKYAVIYADPPWTFATRSQKNQTRAALNHYSTMTMTAMHGMADGIDALAAEDCALFMWATDPLLLQALDLIKAWGFAYKTIGFCWVKQNRKSPGFSTGMGYWTRANQELCLLATRGAPKRRAKDVRRLVVAPRREHSRKPDEIPERIERLVPGPYVELFARTRRPGWDVAFSNQPEKFAAE